MALAKSTRLARQRRSRAPAAPRAEPRRRLPHAERRAQILAKAIDFFSEYGLTGQTRALAEACGVSQRLLYRFFPSKAALLGEVYNAEIVGPFKATWFGLLTDRSKRMEQRLQAFYRDYYEVVLRRRWLRLFLYASLAEVDMAPTYIAEVVSRLLRLIVAEAAREQGLALPRNAALVREIGWILHGTVSHLAIRRHVYGGPEAPAAETVIELQIRAFLAALPAVLPAAARPGAEPARRARAARAVRHKRPPPAAAVLQAVPSSPGD